MKKFAVLALVSLLLVSMLLPSMAAAEPTEVSTPDTTATVEISTKAGSASYLLSFPADVKIPWEQENFALGNVVAKKLLLSPSKKLEITVTSANNFKLVHEKNDKLGILYTLLAQSEEKASFEFGPGDRGKSVPLAVQITKKDWEKAYAGKYADHLTFQIDYVDA